MTKTKKITRKKMKVMTASKAVKKVKVSLSTRTGKMSITRPAQKMTKVPGYEFSEGGVYYPCHIQKPIPADKFRAGFQKAKHQIKQIVSDIMETLIGDYAISEISLTASFNAEGNLVSE